VCDRRGLRSVSADDFPGVGGEARKEQFGAMPGRAVVVKQHWCLNACFHSSTVLGARLETEREDNYLVTWMVACFHTYPEGSDCRPVLPRMPATLAGKRIHFWPCIGFTMGYFSSVTRFCVTRFCRHQVLDLSPGFRPGSTLGIPGPPKCTGDCLVRTRIRLKGGGGSP
jgi:hypothetical protein